MKLLINAKQANQIANQHRQEARIISLIDLEHKIQHDAGYKTVFSLIQSASGAGKKSIVLTHEFIEKFKLSLEKLPGELEALDYKVTVIEKVADKSTLLTISWND